MSYELVKRENCLKELMTRYKTLGSSIIYHVSEQENFDVRKANMALMELTGSITIQHAYKNIPRIENPDQYISIAQIEDCIDSVMTGARVLIILRGMPGSGKSYLANSILRACYSNPNYKDHIHSADNFFMHNGRYIFDRGLIGDAHQWNQRNIDYRMQEGYSPLIVDNTNCQMWEMRSYVAMAVHNGYKIHVLEVNTRWAFNCNELTKRNRHNVPKQTIKAMLERYEMGITAESLLRSFQFSLIYQENPAPRRCPPFSAANGPIVDTQIQDTLNQDLSLPRCKKKDKNDNRPINGIYSSSDQDEEILGGTTGYKNLPKPVQQYKVSSSGAKASKVSPFKFSWDTDIGDAIKNWNLLDPLKCPDETVPTLEKKHTCEIGVNTSMMEFHQDSENSKVIYGKSREISDIRKHMAGNKPGMLDKGCSTHDDVCSDRNEDLKKLIDIFQNIPPLYIRDMYDDCKGNFDMTFEIFLEDSKDYSHLLFNIDNVDSNTNEVQEQKKESESKLTRNISMESLNEASALPQGNIMLLNIPDSAPPASTGVIKKCFKVPTNKMNEGNTPDIFSDDENTCETPNSDIGSDIDDQSGSTKSEYDTIELNFGQFLVKQLEQQFGDPSYNFPDGFQPVVQLPRALARQLYAFYVESAYQQMETQQSILDELVKEDEAFARKLYEEEIGVVHKPPPEGLQEIMNEQAALNIHKKQLPELKTPNDLATQLTKKKLFESFPSVDQGVILQIYHSNDLDYKQTVEDLITSVGDGGLRLDKDIREPPISPSTILELEKAQKDSKATQVDKDEDKTPKQYREEAEYYLRKRNELYQKAQEHYTRGQREVAQFYSQLAQQQTQYFNIANNKAASVFLDENSRKLQNMNTLDLHYLYVKEAIPALDVFIDINIDRLNANGKVSQDLLIITGRGKRSLNGVPKLKPAVMKRLATRKIKYHQMNEGVLKIKIKANTPVTNDL